MYIISCLLPAIVSIISLIIYCSNELKQLFLLQGKFIRINFDVAGYIVGANIETCILLHIFKVFQRSIHVVSIVGRKVHFFVMV